MGNNRGNKYSHASVENYLQTNKKAFFTYSFTELGKYDLPANIDKALLESGRSSLTYIGHSQGTSQMFVALTSDL